MNLRFKCLTFLQRYIDIFTKRKAILICVGVWILALVLQIPNHFGWNEYKFVLHIITNYYHAFSLQDSIVFNFDWSFLIFTLSLDRYDQKNLGCLWDRTHPSPYLFITFGTVVALPTVTILCCYYKIFTYAKMCQAMVSWLIFGWFISVVL